jgi:putative ABC transport system permease protein
MGMQTFSKDIRYAVRSLLKQPGFTALAVITLALGIGANTAIFSVVNAFLLRPLPYGHPERLVMVDSQNEGRSVGVSFLDYQDWRAQNQVFEDLAFFNLRWNANLEFGSDTETLRLTFGTSNLFSTLQVAPMLGHGPTAEDPGTVLISHGLWQRRFGSDPNILGRQLRIDGQSLTVIGVMAPGFRFPFQTDLWWLQDRNFNRENRGFRIDQSVGRLKPGVTVDQASAEMKRITASLAQTFPETNREVTSSVTPLRESWVGANLRTSLWLLLGACTFVLLIACANVANLLLIRASGRTQEFAVRAALGASRWRLVRQSFVEVLLLTLMGSASGLLLGEWGLRALVALLPAELLPFFINFKLDSRVLAFTLLISLFTVVLCGIIPALRSTSVNLNEALKAGGQKLGVSREHQRFGSSLVVTEIALAIVLLVGAGLMVRSLLRLNSTPTGFEDSNVLHLEINPTYKRSEDYNVQYMSSLYQKLINRVAQVPGVIAVAANSDSPFVGQRPWYRGPFSIEGQSVSEQDHNPLVNYQAVSPDYFKVMQIPVLQGRVFTDRDNFRPEGDRDVAIINQRLAKRMWPNGDALGKRINCDDQTKRCAEIIGLVGDVKHNSVDDEFGYDLYYACYQSYSKQTHFLARTSGDPETFAPAIKQAIWEVAPDTGIFNITSVATLSANTIWQRRLSGLLLGSFSALSLVLAVAGIYGVMTYFVAQRTKEIGIRLALGAQRGDVLGLVVRNGMVLALIGLAVGVAGALALTRLLRVLLFEITPTDPLTFGAVAFGLVAVTLIACYVPARRATKVDPLVALRYE